MVKIFTKPSLHKVASQGTQPYAEATLFAVLPLYKLLPEVEKNFFLSKIKEITSLPDDYFKIIYEELIDNFARSVQILPEIYGGELGGLLHDGLRRSLLAIQILHENAESKPHPLFIFAVFSIALLADIGHVFNYQVMISNEEGVFIDEWYPCLGPMDEFGDHYKLRPYADTPASLVREVTPLLARQLLNDTAIAWLSSNNQLFDMWLAFLRKGDNWEGGLWKILKIDPKQFKARKEEITLLSIDAELTEPQGTELGEKFLAWLKHSLQDGSITFNELDSNVHIVQTNELELSVFLETPELFEKFSSVYAKGSDWMAACQQFNALGLTEQSGFDFQIKQFFLDAPVGRSSKLNFLAKEKMVADHHQNIASRVVTAANSIKEGIVIRNAKALFGAKRIAASRYLCDIEMRWKTENLLAKVRKDRIKSLAPTNPKLS